jgi:hypothetical protein
MPLQTRLNFRRFRCEETTENGEDEIYMLVIRTTSEGGYSVARLPGLVEHWDLNDGKEPREVGETTLHKIDLDNHERANIYVVVMEEDGGMPGDWIQRVGNALNVNGEEGGMVQVIGKALWAIGGIFNLFGLAQDTDDYIGSFAVQFENRNGSLDGWHWERGDHATTEADISGIQHSCKISFNGDGSHYFGEFYLDVI